MPDLAKALRAEIRVGAASELAQALAPLRRIEHDLKTLVAILQHRKEGSVGRPGRPVSGKRAGRGKAPAEEPTIRPREVRALRARFKMNRPQFGRLVGVSTWTVFMWEHGKVAPSSASVARLREVENLSPTAAAAASARPRRRRGPGRPRKRPA